MSYFNELAQDFSAVVLSFSRDRDLFVVVFSGVGCVLHIGKSPGRNRFTLPSGSSISAHFTGERNWPWVAFQILPWALSTTGSLDRKQIFFHRGKIDNSLSHLPHETLVGSAGMAGISQRSQDYRIRKNKSSHRLSLFIVFLCLSRIPSLSLCLSLTSTCAFSLSQPRHTGTHRHTHTLRDCSLCLLPITYVCT